jgi:hypothetical protein
MYLLVQYFDGFEGWLRTTADQTLSIHPLIEAALVAIYWWWDFALALEVFFHGDKPGAVLDAGKE